MKYKSKLIHFHSRKSISECRLENGGHLVSASMCWQEGKIHILRSRQNCRHFTDGIFKCIFLNKMYEYRLRFHCSLSPKFELRIFQRWFRMAWRQPGDKPLSEPMVVGLLTHICVIHSMSYSVFYILICCQHTAVKCFSLSCSKWYYMSWVFVIIQYQRIT